MTIFEMYNQPQLKDIVLETWLLDNSYHLALQMVFWIRIWSANLFKSWLILLIKILDQN